MGFARRNEGSWSRSRRDAHGAARKLLASRRWRVAVEVFAVEVFARQESG